MRLYFRLLGWLAVAGGFLFAFASMTASFVSYLSCPLLVYLIPEKIT